MWALWISINAYTLLLRQAQHCCYTMRLVLQLGTTRGTNRLGLLYRNLWLAPCSKVVLCDVHNSLQNPACKQVRLPACMTWQAELLYACKGGFEVILGTEFRRGSSMNAEQLQRRRSKGCRCHLWADLAAAAGAPWDDDGVRLRRLGRFQLQTTFWPSLLLGPYLQAKGVLVAGALEAAVGGPGLYLPLPPAHHASHSAPMQDQHAVDLMPAAALAIMAAGESGLPHMKCCVAHKFSRQG